MVLIANISIHALREEGDSDFSKHGFSSLFDFYPRPPRGGRPDRSRGYADTPVFLSTPSARRATSEVTY